MADIRVDLIRKHLGKLISAFGKRHRPIPVVELFELYNQRDFRGMVGQMKRQMRIDFPIRVCYVNDPKFGPDGGVAWVDSLEQVPAFGSRGDGKHMPNMYLRRSALIEMPFPSLVFAMSHELSHLLLTSFRSDLYDNEEATDLLSILLGYGVYYAAGRIYSPKNFNDMFAFLGKPTYTSGYLSHEEIFFAEAIIRS